MKLPEIIGGVVLLVGATAGTITWSDIRYALRHEPAWRRSTNNSGRTP